MPVGTKACEFFLKILKDWEYCAIDATGLSGGMVATWNPLTCSFKLFRTCAGILLKGNFWGFKKDMHLINVYAPYKDRRKFWDRIHDSGLLSLDNLVLAGDLTLTLHSFETWGSIHSSDPLEEYFVELFN